MTATQIDRAEIISQWLPKLCEALLSADPDIVAIVQFGSSVYAPEVANDIDLFVVTKHRKDLGVYMDAVKDCPLNVDVVPVQVGERAGFVSAGVRAFGRLIWGDESEVLEVTKDVPVLTFDEARQVLEVGKEYLQRALQETSLVLSELHYRNAFNLLFDAARLAVMAFLLTEETRWRVLARQLPDPFDQRFRNIVADLHIAIFYHRTLPLNVETEFERQKEIVKRFIDDLEAASKKA
ncbi:MAG: hypothetical protein N3B10_09995 [Armatimonadetes bacterium]|nr:hypothetical protein [Armatimonadota bacterium]MCX7968798.1 hypothetical protein [Armatimonadota bacterium]MDW8143685.1 hypothetical protein [Armatimonadota bacterium]